MKTPKFIQLTSAGAGQWSSTTVYGLTSDGKVYKWLGDEWVRLKNASDLTYDPEDES